jgi:hypothetical protein
VIMKHLTSRALLANCFMLVSCVTYSSTLKDGGDMFFQNVSWLPMDYKALYPRI